MAKMPAFSTSTSAGKPPKKSGAMKPSGKPAVASVPKGKGK